MKRFERLRKFSFTRKYYMYMDHKNYVMDSLFIQKKVQVDFIKEYVAPGNDYIVVFASVSKKDIQNFEEAFDGLENAILLMGHTDYPAIYKEVWLDKIAKDKQEV